ncbi:hypothetical protein [Aeoliella sp.]|uniref:hypothetical protein n=1 Tax=Aeoliella sp. TaxID=2795800 RepID=UPI003CCB8583
MTSEFFTDPALQQQATAAGYASVETYLQILVERDRERLAIAEGVEAMRSGRVRPFEEFDREFRGCYPNKVC